MQKHQPDSDPVSNPRTDVYDFVEPRQLVLGRVVDEDVQNSDALERVVETGIHHGGDS